MPEVELPKPEELEEIMLPFLHGGH
jgi:hypothetical protein